MPMFTARQASMSYLNGYEVEILKLHLKETETRFPCPCFEVRALRTPTGKSVVDAFPFTAWPDELGMEVD